MHREVVERRRWLDERDFTSALSFCMLLPGPEALQLAICLGWRLHATRGGLVAGLAFIGPAIVLLLALAATTAAVAPTIVTWGLIERTRLGLPWILAGAALAGLAVQALGLA